MRYTTAELAKRCGVSARAITKYASKTLKLEKVGGRWEFTEEEAQTIIAHYAISAETEPKGTNQTQDELAGTKQEQQGTDANKAEPEPNETEPEPVPDRTETERGSEIKFALEILQTQLEEKQKTIEENRKTIDTLLSMIADKDSQIKELSSGYVAEKTAESLERGRAALAPIEEESQEQQRKISFGQRLKFLFTGEFSDSKIDI